jgi:hypothetical protein
LSLALSAVLLLVLFLPGVIARRSYLSYPFSKKYSVSSMTDEVALSVIPALILQFLMLEIVESTTSYRVDFQQLSAILTGGSEVATAIAFQDLKMYVAPIAAYNIAIWSSAATIGLGLRWLVNRFELDLRFNLLRFSNEWYYFLTGRQWRLKLNLDFDVVWVEALVNTTSGMALYSGIFDSYKLAQNGSLDYICLSEARRRMSLDAGTPVMIAGKGLVMKYETILNVNLLFIKLPPDEPTEEPQPETQPPVEASRAASPAPAVTSDR